MEEGELPTSVDPARERNGSDSRKRRRSNDHGNDSPSDRRSHSRSRHSLSKSYKHSSSRHRSRSRSPHSSRRRHHQYDKRDRSPRHRYDEGERRRDRHSEEVDQDKTRRHERNGSVVDPNTQTEDGDQYSARHEPPGAASMSRPVKTPVNTTINTDDKPTNPSLLGNVHQQQSQAYQEEDPDFDPFQKEDEDSLIEQRRKRREAILAKYKDSASVVSTPASVQPDVPAESANQEKDHRLEIKDIFLNESDLQKENHKVSVTQTVSNHSQEEIEFSAADYNPMDDNVNEKRQLGYLNGGEPVEATEYNEMAGSDTRHRTDFVSHQNGMVEDDMFADDEDDIFADPSEKKISAHIRNAAPVVRMSDNPALLDNWDDAEGYYNSMLGERLDNGRYHVFAHLGKGVFSSVVRARDLKESDKDVAIKIIRNNDTMYRAGLKELDILKKLMDADPDDRKHVVRFLRTFEHKNHLCLVFESLNMNLREVLKKFGKDVGIHIKAVRVYAQHVFLALSLLQKCQVLHGDIKPDNALISENKSTLKLADFGSASDFSENEITPYLVSRFYRAPEIILGLPYDNAIDVWSVGCTLFELYTGKILFPGRSNNHMLKLMMDLKGKFNHKMLRKGQFTGKHFDEQLNFLFVDTDKISGKDVVRTVSVLKPTRELRERILTASTGGGSSEEQWLVTQFIDFLDRCLSLNPEKRLSIRDALLHPFILGNKS